MTAMRLGSSERIAGGFVLAVFILFVGTAYAAHPLITDDTGTQGKGKFQIELNSEFTCDKEGTTRETGSEVAWSLSAGVRENIDIIFGLPYTWSRQRQDSAFVSDEDGLSDMSVELKWRFLEKDGLSLALKPGVTLPVGDENKGLGGGKPSHTLFLIATKEIKSSTLHLNMGYTHSRYKLEADRDAMRDDIYHISLAGEVPAASDLRLVGNIGTETNPEKQAHTHPAFALIGLIYSVAENLDIDLGLKTGLNKPETDYTGLAGLAWRF